MPGYYTQRERARALRSNTTDAEQRLWRYLRRRQLLDIQFYRQRPLGCFIADFWAPALKLVVEVDGGQHFEAEGVASDARRDEWMREQGIRVVRFDNRQVLCETEQVLEALLGVMKERLAASLPPSPATGDCGGCERRSREGALAWFKAKNPHRCTVRILPGPPSGKEGEKPARPPLRLRCRTLPPVPAAMPRFASCST